MLNKNGLASAAIGGHLYAATTSGRIRDQEDGRRNLRDGIAFVMNRKSLFVQFLVKCVFNDDTTEQPSRHFENNNSGIMTMIKHILLFPPEK